MFGFKFGASANSSLSSETRWNGLKPCRQISCLLVHTGRIQNSGAVAGFFAGDGYRYTPDRQLPTITLNCNTLTNKFSRATKHNEVTI